MLMKFLTIIAWVFAVLSTILVVMRIHGALTYSDIKRQIDALRGVEATFPIMIPGAIAIVCWAFIFASNVAIE